jgi:hypothetical protein
LYALKLFTSSIANESGTLCWLAWASLREAARRKKRLVVKCGQGIQIPPSVAAG